jgi:multidrug efflux pump
VYIPYDASVFIQDSIHEVFRTLAEAILIVLVIIFLTLGSLRAALIPAVAVPLSLIGGAFLMLLMGFSINLLTLLALVLAIGLVVDDAIVVVENIHRHTELGETRFQAAIKGARELAVPIIAMTTTLVAVYAPFGFMHGLVGTLFTEFAFALAGAVLISGIVALTLSPMLSSKILHVSSEPGPFERGVERFFTGLANSYQNLLHNSLNYVPVTIVFGLLILASIYFMYITSQQELAPEEDQSVLLFQATAPQTATIDYTESYMKQVAHIFDSIKEYGQSFILIGRGGDPSSAFGGFKMPPPSQRKRTQKQIQQELQHKLNKVAGLHIGVFPRPSLPGSSGVPVQFVVTSDSDYQQLDQVVDELLGKAMASGKFMFLQKSIRFTRPQVRIDIDRDLAGDLGISMEEIGRNLAAALGGNYVNRFSLQGRSYKVIPQVAREFRGNYHMLDDYYLHARSGELVPLSTLVTFHKEVEPSSRTQFQQLNSITVNGVMSPGVTLGNALNYLQTQARKDFPRGFTWDYEGDSRQYVEQGSALIITLFMSVLVIYLVLAAQFESWRDPLIILMSVPMSIAGAMIFITLGFATINIYTKVGLITLVGLIAKNGILIVQFANQLQIHEKLGKREAVESAAAIRLRPILMTTVAMIMAMVPLLTASGPGAVSRFHMGLVIATGLGIGTLFTLFVVPAVYVLLARDHQAAEAATQALEQGRPLPDGGA